MHEATAGLYQCCRSARSASARSRSFSASSSAPCAAATSSACRFYVRAAIRLASKMDNEDVAATTAFPSQPG